MPRPSTKDRDLGFIDDILTRSERLATIIGDQSEDAFLRDEVLSLAVERLIEIIGEAASRVSSETRQAMPRVPWREMSDTRNRLIHDYARVNQSIVFKIATESIPEMVAILREELR